MSQSEDNRFSDQDTLVGAMTGLTMNLYKEMTSLEAPIISQSVT